ncbi:hypothetical protein, partial [Burkholderia multivorans]|uniref:hypothetical protein n=1 Tax=Burkholderia multivorans TaxID=87883 RepID=UPI0040457224
QKGPILPGWVKSNVLPLGHFQRAADSTASAAALWCRAGSSDTRRCQSCCPIACCPGDVKAFEGTDDFLCFVYAGEQVEIGWRDIAFVEQNAYFGERDQRFRMKVITESGGT